MSCTAEELQAIIDGLQIQIDTHIDYILENTDSLDDDTILSEAEIIISALEKAKGVQCSQKPSTE